MNPEKVLRDLEKTIKKVSKDIQQKSGSVGSEKLDSLSKLTNAYSRLYERHKLSGLYPLPSDDDDQAETVMTAKRA